LPAQRHAETERVEAGHDQSLHDEQGMDRDERAKLVAAALVPSKICKAKRPVRLTLNRDAACRQGIAGSQCLDDVCPMAALCRREMHPDIGRNAQVQVVPSTPPTGVWHNNTGHETRLGRCSLMGNRWAADQALVCRPACDYFLPFFFAAFFAGAFFFAAAMVHLSSVLRPLMRPLRNVDASGQPVEGGLVRA
jgi:hypothetical protein